MYFTNSLLVAVTNWGNMNYTTNTTVYHSTDPGGIFQTTIGAGSHYLANGSTNRNAGTAVNLALLLELRKKTTYPPVELATNFTANTILSPQAARDTSPWDLGFHYDPIDFTISSAVLSNATLVLTNGVVLGTRPGTNPNPGFSTCAAAAN